MSQIKNEIQSLQEQLSSMKKGYSKFIEKIKETFYDKEDFWDENSKRKPNNDYDKVSAAYCLAKRECPRTSFDIKVEKLKRYHKKRNGDVDFKNYTLFDVYKVSDTSFRFRDERRRDEPAIVVKMKDIKLLDEICKKAWVSQVSDRYSKTILGFNEWLEKISIEDLYKLIVEQEKNVFTINERRLYVKDFVVILQETPQTLFSGYYID